MIHQFVFAEPIKKSTWIEIDIITGIIQNTATKETYTLGESPRIYGLPGPLPNFYRWGRIGNSGGGSGPGDYRLGLTDSGLCRQWKYKLVALNPEKWPNVNDIDDLSVDELKAIYQSEQVKV